MVAGTRMVLVLIPIRFSGSSARIEVAGSSNETGVTPAVWDGSCALRARLAGESPLPGSRFRE